MNTKTFDVADLKKPFAPSEIEWRLLECGRGNSGIWAKCAPYITNRAIMDRLDSIVGPEHWSNEFKSGPDGGVVCRLSIKINGEWIDKWDGAGNTDIEGVKGGLSNAMKRAAVQWGIGRYLYDLEIQWAEIEEKGRFYAKLPEKHGGGSFRWSPPRLPDWAAQKESTEPEQASNDKPSAAASSASKALASVRNAPSVEVWQRYKQAIEIRIEQNEWTAAEVKLLEAAIVLRGAELSAPAEPEGVDEPAESPDQLKRNMMAALALKLGCPQDDLNDWIDLAMSKDDPGAFLNGKPWAPKGGKSKQKELV